MIKGSGISPALVGDHVNWIKCIDYIGLSKASYSNHHGTYSSIVILLRYVLKCVSRHPTSATYVACRERDQLSCWPLYSQQVSHQRWIWGPAHRQESASEKSALALKPRADVTRSPKQGYQWLHKKDLCPTNIKRNIYICVWINHRSGWPSRFIEIS